MSCMYIISIEHLIVYTKRWISPDGTSSSHYKISLSKKEKGGYKSGNADPPPQKAAGGRRWADDHASGLVQGAGEEVRTPGRMT